MSPSQSLRPLETVKVSMHRSLKTTEARIHESIERSRRLWGLTFSAALKKHLGQAETVALHAMAEEFMLELLALELEAREEKECDLFLPSP
jgi:hypothetical protein